MTCLCPRPQGPSTLTTACVRFPSQEEKRDLENQIALSRLSTEDLTEAVCNLTFPVPLNCQADRALSTVSKTKELKKRWYGPRERELSRQFWKPSPV